MKRIIFVPGKNPKPPEDLHREQLLRCLLHGVRQIDQDTAAAIKQADSFTLVGWNHLFYDEVRDINKITPWIDELLSQDCQQTGSKNNRPQKYRLAKLMYQLGDTFPSLIPFIPDERIKRSIADTERYFSNHKNLACRVRDMQKQPLREFAGNGDKVLLIGHSMGSVIAWDALWELHHLEGIQDSVELLLTIGSPLGMNYVQRRLIGLNNNHPHPYPGNIRAWANVAARGDLVALDPSLANDFSAMLSGQYIDRIDDYTDGIYNYYRDTEGLNVHKSYGYLVNPVVSRLITDWWNNT